MSNDVIVFSFGVLATILTFGGFIFSAIEFRRMGKEAGRDQR